ncbi:unnamed protein product [Moneuplotes crassus]|uniref:Uncharacterized protein n=1 Tax=Euplotes crassus TaxID=5936 RepID=A0AAD1X8J8_EUPCR|nr:unnamed protein product [Moneuplotes crassus]
MEFLSNIIAQAKKDGLTDLAGKGIQLQVIEVDSATQGDSEALCEWTKVMLWDGTDQIKAKIKTDVFTKMTKNIEKYSVIKFNACCFSQEKNTKEKTLVVKPEVEVIKQYAHKIHSEEEVKTEKATLATCAKKTTEIEDQKKEDTDLVKEIQQRIKLLSLDDKDADDDEKKNEDEEHDDSENDDKSQHDDKYQYLPISQISVCHNYQKTDWEVKARVAEVSKIKIFNNNWSYRYRGQSFRVVNIILSDYYTGDEIEGAFYNELIEKFFNVQNGDIVAPTSNPDHIQQGCVYIISGCTILDNKITSPIKHRRKLNFKEYSVVKRCEAPKKKSKRKVSFTYHHNLENKIGKLVNISGIVSKIDKPSNEEPSEATSTSVSLDLLIFNSSEEKDFEKVSLQICDKEATIVGITEGEVIFALDCEIKKEGELLQILSNVQNIRKGKSIEKLGWTKKLKLAYQNMVTKIALKEAQSKGKDCLEESKIEGSTIKCKVVIPPINYSQNHLLFTQKCKTCKNYQDIQEDNKINKEEFCKHCKFDSEFSLEYKIQCSIVLETGATYQCVMKNLCAHEILPKPALKLFKMSEDTRRELLETCTKDYSKLDSSSTNDSFCEVILDNPLPNEQDEVPKSYSEDIDTKDTQTYYEIKQITSLH